MQRISAVKAAAMVSIDQLQRFIYVMMSCY